MDGISERDRKNSSRPQGPPVYMPPAKAPYPSINGQRIAAEGRLIHQDSIVCKFMQKRPTAAGS